MIEQVYKDFDNAGLIPLSIDGELDLFRFTEAPIFERLDLYREQV